MRNEVTLVNEEKPVTANNVAVGDIFRFPKGKDGSFYMRVNSESWKVIMTKDPSVSNFGILAVHLTTGLVYYINAERSVEIISEGQEVNIKVGA